MAPILAVTRLRDIMSVGSSVFGDVLGIARIDFGVVEQDSLVGLTVLNSMETAT
jgi:hypothetical protein